MKMVWLREEECVITNTQFKYFYELIKFKEAHIKEWIIWKRG